MCHKMEILCPVPQIASHFLNCWQNYVQEGRGRYHWKCQLKVQIIPLNIFLCFLLFSHICALGSSAPLGTLPSLHMGLIQHWLPNTSEKPWTRYFSTLSLSPSAGACLSVIPAILARFQIRGPFWRIELINFTAKLFKLKYWQLWVTYLPNNWNCWRNLNKRFENRRRRFWAE